MSEYPPPSPTPPPPYNRPGDAPFYRRPFVIGMLALIALLIAIGVARGNYTAGDAAPTDPASSAAAPTASSSRAAPTTASGRTSSTPPSDEPLATTAVTQPPTTKEDTPEVDFAMPDLTGRTLQSAQNAVQDLGVFFSRSHDLRGSRRQVFDRGWQVCTQDPVAGTRVTGDRSSLEGSIDFGVVRVTEDCP